MSFPGGGSGKFGTFWVILRASRVNLEFYPWVFLRVPFGYGERTESRVMDPFGVPQTYILIKDMDFPCSGTLMI